MKQNIFTAIANLIMLRAKKQKYLLLFLKQEMLYEEDVT